MAVGACRNCAHPGAALISPTIALAQIPARLTLEALRWLRKIFWRTAIILFLAVVILAVAGYFHPQPFLCVDSGEVKADVMVVLGGGVHDRPARAADLYSRHDAPEIILTGQGDDLINWRILRDAGVPARAIQI